MKNNEKHLSEVDHSYIRYANVWEDPYLLLEGLSPKKGEKILAISSAGDNAFALLVNDPSLVVAVDLNKVQLYLTELKKVAIQQLSQEEFISFIGFKESSTRLEVYQLLRSSLSKEAVSYWDNKQSEITNGLIYNGKFEKYLGTFAKKILPWIHSKKRVNQMFAQKSENDQKKFFENKWNSWRWKTLFRIFFSKKIMGMLGRDPAFLAQVETNVGKTIMASAAKHLSSIHSQNNPMLHYCLKGNFGEYLPFYAQKKNYDIIKKNIDKLALEFGYAQDVSKKYGTFDAFNLSNIFEYMNQEVFEITATALKKIANPGARFGYWNLMVQREISSIDKDFTRLEDKSSWAERDQGFFYMQLVIDRLK